LVTPTQARYPSEAVIELDLVRVITRLQYGKYLPVLDSNEISVGCVNTAGLSISHISPAGIAGRDWHGDCVCGHCHGHDSGSLCKLHLDWYGYIEWKWK
jgi:hypothetical protein